MKKIEMPKTSETKFWVCRKKLKKKEDLGKPEKNNYYQGRSKPKFDSRIRKLDFEIARITDC